MILITSDDQLRLYLPNALATVQGEMSLFDKLSADLQLAENWLSVHFLDTSLLTRIAEEEGAETAGYLCRRIVVADALLRAVPSLDLVLTPNGFGIVSNQNIAPASKDRVDRLLSNLELTRDRALQQLLYLLPGSVGADWLQTEQGQFFSATLFPFMDIPHLLGHHDKLWERYEQYRAQLILMEAELAEKFISPALMQRLRTRYIINACDIVELDLCNRLRAISLALLKGQSLDIQSLHQMVTFIRQNPADFPEWAASDTAGLYTNQSFQNKPNSPGYWF